MKIEIARDCGFCFGVKRAVKIAEESGGAPTIGELIHNAQEIERLEKDYGVKTYASIEELKGEKKVVVRTHGITKGDLQTLQDSGVEVVDATCPFVQKPQKIAREMSEKGYEIVVFGDANHPEVRGVVSYCETPTYVVLDESELEPIKLSSKVAVLSQTTKKAEKFGKIVAYLTRRCKEVRVFNTICNATLKNQDAVRDLATKADVMVIVGGKNSSNTKQLHLIAKSICQNSYHVEKEEELEAAWFEGKKFCGVSAGASTPEWIIKKIVARIEKLSQNPNF